MSDEIEDQVGAAVNASRCGKRKLQPPSTLASLTYRPIIGGSSVLFCFVFFPPETGTSYFQMDILPAGSG